MDTSKLTAADPGTHTAAAADTPAPSVLEDIEAKRRQLAAVRNPWEVRPLAEELMGLFAQALADQDARLAQLERRPPAAPIAF